jgi:hypothetical protein
MLRAMDHRLARVLAAPAGFLLAVLWMDLMFDAQYFTGEPAAAATSIAAYYRRVTLDAGWMTWLIAAVMFVTMVGTVLQLRRSSAPRWQRIATALLAFGPIALALAVVFPAARELAVATSPANQLDLVRLIAWSHVACFAAMGGFLAIQIRRAM